MVVDVLGECTVMICEEAVAAGLAEHEGSGAGRAVAGREEAIGTGNPGDLPTRASHQLGFMQNSRFMQSSQPKFMPERVASIDVR